jgi:hypothetical protein
LCLSQGSSHLNEGAHAIVLLETASSSLVPKIRRLAMEEAWRLSKLMPSTTNQQTEPGIEVALAQHEGSCC